ncbi:peptidoglycan binding domain-containing protein [Aspergillus sclerotioniger CBS 115572]|uniref:Peptidoglycan binding domain-containing protein n=1 Tax=Aspergillus sclerotioniger CBS 115572 TaxID=1450535 RepID=A0A317X7M4_9EURO|nr:peptidoglycan binding domain-containing protein [Aspergillus sclerotioniger CBS 115572]PWY93557.1 peptidoglycan binding domain-containing protein [Aspergillus sclerotioniger CBS 115572]
MSPKRLIVCCDGTWKDATADNQQPPSNVTRLTRTLSRVAVVEENGQTQEIPQIVYYQKGVGTGLGDKYFGVRNTGVAGIGLSANVRAGYGFLVDNYTPGDKIYFFGFSRGAYTARAIAGLVCELGLLTPRGMDNFANVYDDFYNRKLPVYDDEKRRQLGFRDRLPRFTVQIIGVWDTVGFHKPWLWSGEKLEFRNTLLSRGVRYAFHALALDEERSAYQPTLWHEPEDGDERQELLQVWFSGVHTDVGGGGEDPRLANVALGWMIAQCMKDGQLSFDVEGYLFDDPPRGVEVDAVPWATVLGKSDTGSFTRTVETILGGKSKRTPLGYRQVGGGESRPTNEMIHVSIKDRVLNGEGTTAGAVSWPSLVVKAAESDQVWTLHSGKELAQTVALEQELFMKGRIRTVHVDQVD